MIKNLQLFSNLTIFESQELEDKYSFWKQSSQYAQVAAITFLTACLYLVYAGLDLFLADGETRSLMLLIHLYINVPVLLMISFIAYKRVSFTFLFSCLFLAPIVAVIGNLFILSSVVDPRLYITEHYLIIFWIFTISGLKLRHAMMSAFIGIVILAHYSLFYLELTKPFMLMHGFWILSSFAFGCLGAYLIEKYSRTIFLNKQTLEDLALKDSLTGLYNRSKLNDTLGSELQRYQRYGGVFAVVMMDIDSFKKVNDTFGHLEGDKVLVSMAHLLSKHTRSSDIVIRWGGEEFVIIYLRAEKIELPGLVNTIRIAIESFDFETVGRQTASFGVTLVRKEDSVTSLMQRVDKALYQAKDNGKNCIVLD